MWEVPGSSIGRGTFRFETIFVVFSSLSKRAVVHLLTVKRKIKDYFRLYTSLEI